MGTDTTTGDGPGRDLPIATRRVLSAGGRVVRHLTVHCDRREERVTLRACKDCALCERIEPPTPEREGRVRCIHPSVGDADSGRPALNAPVREAMAHDITCVTEDVDVDTVTAILLREQPGGVPVVDAAGALRGLLTEADVLAAREHSSSRRTTAGDLDCSRALVVHADVEVTRAAAIMALEGVSALAVVGEDGVLQGQISLSDVARWVARADGFIVPAAAAPGR